MVTQLYANHGKGAADGTAATNTLLSGGGDNALLIGGSTGWTFAAADRSPDGPADGHGFRRTPNNTTSYLRAAWTATGSRNGARFWLYLNGAPAANWNCARMVSAAETAVVNVFQLTTGAIRLTLGTSTVIAASASGAITTPGWYCFTVIGDDEAGRIQYRVQNSVGTVVHSWDSGAGAYTLPNRIQGFRMGEPSASLHGINPIRLGSNSRWGTIDSGWILAGDPYFPPADPPPATSRVSHYNTAEGLDYGSTVSSGVGVGVDGVKFSNRLGTTGATIEVAPSGTTPIKGNRSYVVKAGDGQAYVQWGMLSLSLAARAHFRLTSVPSATTRVMVLRNESDEPVANLYLAANGTVLLQAGRLDPIQSQTLAGVVDYSHGPVRLELWANIDTDTVRARWGYADSGVEGAATLNVPLGDIPLTLAQYGKLLSSSWTDEFVMDDLAANYAASSHIGGYALEYLLLPSLGPNISNQEPGTPFTLSVLSGYGPSTTWVQVDGVPVALTVDPGTHSATGLAPYALADDQLLYDYDDAKQSVHVLRSTERIVLGTSSEQPLRIEII